MSVLTFKPHTIQIYETQSGITDENGDYTGDISTLSSPIKCDIIQSDGRADGLPFDDGKNDTYSYTIYLPTSIRDLNVGEEVQLNLYNGKTVKKSIKGFKRYQLQCKAWV